MKVNAILFIHQFTETSVKGNQISLNSYFSMFSCTNFCKTSSAVYNYLLVVYQSISFNAMIISSPSHLNDHQSSREKEKKSVEGREKSVTSKKTKVLVLHSGKVDDHAQAMYFVDTYRGSNRCLSQRIFYQLNRITSFVQY